MQTRIARRNFLTGMAALAAPSVFSAEKAAEVPLYWKDALVSAAKRVKERSARKGARASFWFITDLHIGANACHSGAMLAELFRETGVNRVFCGGDIPCAFGGKKSLDECMDKFKRLWAEPLANAGATLFTAKGNHDFTVRDDPKATTGWTYSSREARDFIVETSKGNSSAPSNSFDPTACYFVHDDPLAKLRYIAADTNDTDSGRHEDFWGTRDGVHPEQLRWLAGVLATTPQGWNIIFLHHISCMSVAGNEGERKTFAPLRELLEAYQNRKKVAVAGVEIDFSVATGRILMDLTGHHHAERQTFWNGILHITNPCDAAYRDYIGGSYLCGKLPEKKRGTVYEQTFDAFHWNAEENTIAATRIGGGQDRVYHLQPIVLAPGETKKLATTEITPVEWTCHDGDRREQVVERYQVVAQTFHNDYLAISADGTVTGKKAGFGMAYARDKDFRKEIFCIEVRA